MNIEIADGLNIQKSGVMGVFYEGINILHHRLNVWRSIENADEPTVCFLAISRQIDLDYEWMRNADYYYDFKGFRMNIFRRRVAEFSMSFHIEKGGGEVVTQ